MQALGGQGGVFSKVVLGFGNFRYDLWGDGGDIWRRPADPGAKTPIGASGNLMYKMTLNLLSGWDKDDIINCTCFIGLVKYFNYLLERVLNRGIFKV
jgi:hypothetical protein